MTLHFITGNKGKFNEAKAIFPEVQQLDLELEEIQSLDARVIAEHKLRQALSKQDGEFFIEDTSLYLGCLNGFPGPLIKWFLESMGAEGIYNLVEKYENNSAVAASLVGYARKENNQMIITFFEAREEGTIVAARGDLDFGWGPIFQPLGQDKTHGELGLSYKMGKSMRGKALQQLKEYLKDSYQENL